MVTEPPSSSGAGKAGHKAKGGRDSGCRVRGEGREMRDAATVLGIIHDRGRRGLPLEDVYRQR